MAQRFSTDYLEDLVRAIFQAHGSPPSEAALVARLLVQAEAMGLPSHGLLRVPQYVDDIGRGFIVPGAPAKVCRPCPTAVQVDGQWNFGQVGATRAVGDAIELAVELGVGCASLRRCRHVGRLGAYTEMAAEKDCLALATCSTSGEGHWVAPFGGREGRLGTNPLSFAAPTAGRPLVLDCSTSALPEGKVRFFRDTGQALPPDSLVDRNGRPSTDPGDLYRPDGTPAGAILTFGGSQGYKGFGLSCMAQILSSLVGEPTWREEGGESCANTMWIMVVHLGAWMAADRFKEEANDMLDYIRSSAPAAGSGGVSLPGQREFESEARCREEGVAVTEEIWSRIAEIARQAGIAAEAG